MSEILKPLSVNKATTGHIELPGGLIMQWGQGLPVGTETYPFDISFPNAVLSCVATASGTGSSNVVAEASLAGVSLTQSIDGMLVRYIAIGY